MQNQPDALKRPEALNPERTKAVVEKRIDRRVITTKDVGTLEVMEDIVGGASVG
jgi:hypothetical protein